jgi:hypothetical protein
MARHDDAIRRGAEHFREAAIQRRIADEAGAVVNAELVAELAEARARVVREQAADRQAREAEVLELCGRFLVWATENDIPYNSPSRMRGAKKCWVLGYRVGQPHNRFSEFFYHNPLNNDFVFEVGHKPGPGMSLLMSRSGLAGELPTYIERTGSDSSARRRMRLHNPDLAAYDISTIEESIARFSARHDVEWQG